MAKNEKSSTNSNNSNKLVVLDKTKKVSKSKNNKVTLNKNTSSKSPLDVTEKKKKKKKSGKILNLVLAFFMLIGISIMIVIMCFCGYIVMSAPPFNTDLLYNKEASIFYDKYGNEFARIGAEQRETKYYDDLPQVLIDAIVATEDSRFFQHNGFDVVRFAKASAGQLVGQSGAGGASTLTMQVVKNTFTSTEASGWEGIVRKFTDIYMSIFLVEKNYTKEQIIEFYVNAPGLGQNTFGVEQASQKYFGKSVSDLTLSEAAIIAGIFNAPSIYNPFYSTELTTERRNTVLNLMVRHGYITEEQAADAKAISVESLTVERSTASLNQYQQYLDVAIREVIEKTGMDPTLTPMLVYTELDPEIQDYMTALNEGTLKYTKNKNEKRTYKWKTYKYNDYKDVIQFAAVVTDVHNGSIAAVNNGRHQDAARLLPRSTQMVRNPGSTAKPIFAYGPYLEYNNGSPSTLFYDNKMTYSNGTVITNSDNTYKGAMTMRQALAQSRNIPAIQAFMAVDKNKISDFVHNLGIDYCQYGNGRNSDPTDCNLYEPYAIGGGIDLSPKDMAGAYGAFARNGYYIEPYTVSKVIFRETDETREYKYEKTQAMSEETAYLITDMLITATKQGVGGDIKVSGTEIASKTGTSTYDYNFMKNNKIPDSASMDNWIITYSPDYVISCWYGVDVAGPKVYTNAIDAAIQRKYIMAALANNIYKTNSKFSEPSGVISAKYEIETNPAQLPSDYTPSSLISRELFKKGTEPSEVSDRFDQLQNPTNGRADVIGNEINLSWNGITTPNAIDNTYLENYFQEYYGSFAQTYLNKRLKYNEENIGNVVYDIYLKNDNGLQKVATTANTNYSYHASTSGTYNFVIKSAYSIFNANTSSGTEITVSIVVEGNPDTPPINDPENSNNNSPTEPEQ